MLMLALAAEDTRSSFESGLMLMGVGMLVVFVALIIIGESTALLGRLMKQRASGGDVHPDPVREGEGFPAPAPSIEEMDARTLAVIAAAAATAVGLNVPVRVRRITRAAHVEPSGSAWTEAGRLGLQTSHNVRR